MNRVCLALLVSVVHFNLDLFLFSYAGREKLKTQMWPEPKRPLILFWQVSSDSYLGTPSTEDAAGILGTWQLAAAAAASFKADEGTALKVLGKWRALRVFIEFTVATEEGTVNRMLFPIRTWVVAELAAVTWWLRVLWELAVCVILEGCSKAEPVDDVDDELVCTSAAGVLLLRCKPLYTPVRKRENHLVNKKFRIPYIKDYRNHVQPEAWRMPFTPIPRTTSSFILMAISCSDVTKAVAANWALAESNVFETKP